MSPESAPPHCALGRPDCIGLPPCTPVAPDCIDRCSALRAWWPARTAWELRLARRVARTESVVRRVATCYVPRCGTGDLSCVSAASNKALVDPKFHGEVQLEQAGRRVIRLQGGPRHWWRCALARRVAPCVGGGVKSTQRGKPKKAFKKKPELRTRIPLTSLYATNGKVRASFPKKFRPNPKRVRIYSLRSKSSVCPT